MDMSTDKTPTPSKKRARNSGASGIASGYALGEAFDDTLTDNLRNHKRFLSEAMASDLSRLNMAQEGAKEQQHVPSSTVPMQTDFACSPSQSSRSDRSAACSMLSGDTDVSSARRGSSSVSPIPSGYPVSSLHSPRQKARHRGSPLKAGLPYPKSPRFGGGPGSHHLSKLSRAAMEARERLPPSPSDSHASMDLRRAALIRSALCKRESSSLGQQSHAGPFLSPLSEEMAMPDGLASKGRLCAIFPPNNEQCSSPRTRLGSAFMKLGFSSPAQRKLEVTEGFQSGQPLSENAAESGLNVLHTEQDCTAQAGSQVTGVAQSRFA